MLFPSPDPALEALWHGAPAPLPAGDPARLAALPEPARRYLRHAIGAGAPPASAVRLRMHGTIRLKQHWYRFEAEQVIRRDGAMLWQAGVAMHGLPVRGYDCLLDGAGRMQWKLLGLLPLQGAAGPDISRSTAGRVGAEYVWLPPALCAGEVAWSAPGAAQDSACARFSVAGHALALALEVDGDGRLRRLTTERWGDPDGSGWRSAPFGGHATGEACFDGYTIPTELRIGWRPHAAGFDGDGEFFRVTVDSARFR